MVTKRHVAVVNAGSSSVKLDVLSFPSEDTVFAAIVDRVGRDGARLEIHTGDPSKAGACTAADAGAAVDVLLGLVEEAGIVVDAVGHRVVHGGAVYTDAVVIDDDVERGIEAHARFAPLHNPVNLAGIRRARTRLPHVPHVAVFDTAFHATLPDEAARYAIPKKYWDEGVRRYGFHGTSHRYVAERAAAFFLRPLSTLRLVTLHLGNGCSACAIDSGKSIDTSMGMTPLEGLIMGTRSGDIDAAVVLHMAKSAGIEETERILNKESGLLGLSGKSPDMRDLLQLSDAGDADAALAVRAFCLRARKVVGAYATALGGLDAIVFTGGIGENAAPIRKEICRGLGVVGALLDDRKNEAKAKSERDIASLDSRVRLLVLPTDEERAIAMEALRFLAVPA